MRTFYRVLFLLAAVLGTLQSQATHLVGGSMSYRYVRTLANGNIVYQIRVDVYRDASKDGTGNANAAFDEDITIGVHINNSALDIIRRKVIFLTDDYIVNPVTNTTCPQSLTYRVQYGLYLDTIILPPSSVGYHLTFVRCCRNTQDNLPNASNGQPFQGQTYYTKIPPTNIQNSSPFFSLLPIPLICAGDTTNVLLTASDPDKDSLVYRFVTPFNGGSNTDNGAKPEPEDNLTLPLPNVKYNSGYSSGHPFGGGDYTSISSANGLTSMYAPSEGRYAVAIRVDEYRNGVLINSVYLDLQYFVIECPPNRKPVITNAGQHNYREIEAGATLCYTLNGSDQDGDSVYIEGFGDMLTGANGWTGPKATLPNTKGVAVTSSQFCWTPSCDQASDKPYVYAVRIRDNGCLPKYETYNFLIKVNPFKGPDAITGKPKVCHNETTTYNLTATTPGSTITWSVTNGVLVSGQGTSAATVRWTTVGNGAVKATEVSPYACTAPELKYDVEIIALPQAPNISGDSSLCINTTHKYSIAGTKPSLTYQWFVKGGSIQGSSTGTSVDINWPTAGTGRVSVISIASTGSGCASDTTHLDVEVLFPDIKNFKGSQSVCPYVRGVEYSVEPTEGSVYQWMIIGGTKASGGNSSTITVNWGPEGKGKIRVVEINKHGCPSDTFDVIVDIGYILEGMDPMGPKNVCEFTKLVKYSVFYTNRSSYAWSVNGGTIISGNTTNEIVVDWGSASGSPGRVYVQETSYDSVNNKPCIGKIRHIDVIINPLPIANNIEGKMELCQHTGSYDYKLSGFAGSTYKWEIFGPTNTFTGQGTSQIRINWTLPGTYTIRVQETSQFDCPGEIIDTVVIVHPKPVTSPISGDTIICFPRYSNNPYRVVGFPNSTYAWTLNGGTPASVSTDSNIVVNWNGQRYSSLRVVETSEFGCLGDPVSQNVITDNPRIKLNYISVGYPDNRMEIKWQLMDGELYNSNFTIQKRKTGTEGEWTTVRKISKDTFFFLETKINTDEKTYDYRIIGKNLCGDEISSAIHTHVLLKGKQPEPYHVDMNFTNYRGWPAGVNYYELYRKLPGKTDFELYKIFTDDSSVHFYNGLDHFTQCYRIKAYEYEDGEEISWSNEICFDFEPLIWVPNAFTPNSDTHNPVFKVVSAALMNYEIQIYNRWGEKIFQTSNPEEHWDGTYNGHDCAQGVYVYKILYSGYDNHLKQLSGNVHLIR